MIVRNRQDLKIRKNSSKNRRTEYKNKKFGFGGQKRYLKKNTAESTADFSGKKSSAKWERPANHAQKGKKGKQKTSRPGKNVRQKMRSKK